MSKIATQSVLIPVEGLPSPEFVVREGQGYPDDHPAVLAHPELFVTPDEWLDRNQPEQATANPGEVRRVRRG